MVTMKCLQQHTLSKWAWFGTCESDHFAFSCIGYCQRHPLTCPALEIFKNSEPCRFDQSMIDAASPRSGSGLNRSPLYGEAHNERRRCQQTCFEESFTVDHTTNDERRSSQQTCFWGVLYSWSYYLIVVNARNATGKSIRRGGQRREPTHPLTLCREPNYILLLRPLSICSVTNPGEGGT